MSNWSQIIQLPETSQQQIWTFYEQANCPFEIRQELAEWFELQNWLDMNRQLEWNCSACVINLDDVMASLTRVVDEKMATLILPFPMNCKWNNFRERLHTDRFGLLQTINECVKFEMSIVQDCIEGNSSFETELGQLDHLFGQANHEFGQAQLLCLKLESNAAELNLAYDQSQTFETLGNEDISLNNQIHTQIDNLLEQYRFNKAQLVTKQQQMLQLLEELHDGPVGVQLASWKRNNKVMSIGRVKQTCEMLAQGFGNLLKQLKRLETILVTNHFACEIIDTCFKEIKARVIERLRRLINETFVITEQPNQLLKKEKKIQVCACLLIANVFNVTTSLPVVSLDIISESQARELHLNPWLQQFTSTGNSSELSNNKCRMSYNQTSRQLCVKFTKLQLKEVTRCKQATKKVTDEKVALLFSTEFALDEDVNIMARVFSVPVVMLVHGKQEKDTMPIIRWDNAFAQENRVPFEVPNQVRFADLATHLLSPMFREIGVDNGKGRGLTSENIHFLACKLLGRFDLDDASNEMISWEQFRSAPLPEATASWGRASFWDWFYEVWQLTCAKHMAPLWLSGCIHGFLSKTTVQQLLMACEPGTFMLRFSESVAGAICITAVVERKGQKVIYMIDPIEERELKHVSLSDVLRHYGELLRLYPNRDKDQVLFPFYTTPKKRNGYVKGITILELPQSDTSLATCS